jgi:hypothetical protein
MPTTASALSRTRPGHPSTQPAPRASLSVIAWRPAQDLHLREWVEAGRRLGATARCSQWWIGDWLHYGAARWGEKYKDAARVTGYDIQTLKNIAYVASRYAPSRRRDHLAWSHHETVAALEPGDQDRWLDLAAAEKLSVADLRLEVRTARRVAAAASTAHCEQLPAVEAGREPAKDAVEPADEEVESAKDEAVGTVSAICPACSHRFAVSLGRTLSEVER